MHPGADGPSIARSPTGHPVDLFDLTDYLADRFHRIYVIDLDGLERDVPQLDYLQEITRDTDVWVDAGLRSADSVIDILVTGARRAVVSTARFRTPAELERALGLTPELALEIHTDSAGRVLGDPQWGEELARSAHLARALGVQDLIVNGGDSAVDWAGVRLLSRDGPVWVGGRFEPADEAHLAPSGASGGFFHIGDILDRWARGEEAG
jgi:hypothetical protein